MATQNGNSNGTHSANGESKGSLVLGQTSQGLELRGSLVRLTRYTAVFEIYNPALVLRTSEVIENFKVVVRDRTIYSGRAIVRSMVNAGLTLVCEVKLNEASFCVLSISATGCKPARKLREFIGQWQRVYKVLPEFKVVIADMQTFLVRSATVAGAGGTGDPFGARGDRAGNGTGSGPANRRMRSCRHSTRCTNGWRAFPTTSRKNCARRTRIFRAGNCIL